MVALINFQLLVNSPEFHAQSNYESSAKWQVVVNLISYMTVIIIQ
jgi:hypothetical protein